MAALGEAARERLRRALEGALEGEVRFDNTNRAAYASDSSNYRQVPLGVVFPRHEQDVVATARIAAETGAPLLARGAGTSLAGQACNEALVVDMSRHMNRVVSIDPDARCAVVEPGVVLDDLRRQTEQHGLTFGPDPATHAWCTLGGMIGNNSCGTHGLYAGKTSDNVESLRVVLAGGELVQARSYPLDALGSLGGRLGTIVASLSELSVRYREEVALRYPDIPRRVSGYNLDELDRGGVLHLARALVGTESTCGFTTQATLRLVSSPPVRSLVVIGYPDVYAAAEAVPELLSHPLLALEGFDQTLVDQTVAHGLNLGGVAALPQGHGWLLAELGGESEDEAREKADALARSLPSGLHWKLVHDPAEARLVWSVRESGLGATAIRQDGQHNLEGWEDGAVPPAHLAQYLRGIEELWARHGYSGAWYGHFGQGCVHTRNNFNMSTKDGLARYRSYVTAAAELVVSLGGSLSGEHGDGQSRGELLEVMFGPRIVGAFREFKAVFDPAGLMNPGKVVDAYPLDSNVRYVGLHEPAQLSKTRFALAGDEGSLLHGALRCVGVGRCRRDDMATMCPSYRATRDEVHSTRGRAKVMVEMFRGDLVQASWRNEEVRQALDLCLSCKACASDCPTHVDMATYKSEFYSHYYQGRLRPRAMYAMGLVPLAARAIQRAPFLGRAANTVLARPVLGAVLKKVAGITTARPAPHFRSGPGVRDMAGTIGALDRPVEETTVVVWPDTFTDSFAAQAGVDVVAALASLGEAVAVPSRWACCGRSLYDFGMLGLARHWLSQLMDALGPWVDAGLPVVVPEPSCLAAFRDELPALFPDDERARRLASLARSLSEHLVGAGHLDKLGRASGVDQAGQRDALFHPHCHQRSVVGTDADQQVLAALGYRPRVLDAGCCGLAGSFGFNASHEGVSRTIGTDLWLPRVEAELRACGAGSALVVDGFSCREQLKHLGPHLAGRATTLAHLVRARL